MQVGTISGVDTIVSGVPFKWVTRADGKGGKWVQVDERAIKVET